MTPEEYRKAFIAKLENIEVVHKNNRLNFQEGILHACKIIRISQKNGGKIILIGNGGSESIASHFAVDFWHAKKIRSVTFNSSAALTCISNDHGYEFVYSMQMDMFAEKDDVLIAISSSGESQNIINATNVANKKNMEIITFSGFNKNNKLNKKGILSFYVGSNSYGFVEISHSFILHCILDSLEE